MGAGVREPRQEAEPVGPAPGATRGASLDDGVILRASRGDGQAWRILVEAYSGRLFALAHSRVRRADLAEEITQAVFATIAMKLTSGAYEERGRFESWLFRVAMNRVRDEMRRSRRRPDPVDPERLSEAPAPTGIVGGGVREEALDADELERLRSALGELADRDREVVELRHHGQMAFKQIAEVFGEPMGTVLARHHRALAKLRTILDRQASGTLGADHA